MNSTLSTKPLRTVFIHSLLFSVPFLLLITNSGSGLASLVLLAVGLWCWPAGWAALRPQLGQVRGLLLAFGLNLALMLGAYLLDHEVRLRDLEKPVRMLAAASAMLTVLALRPRRKALWWGLIAGTVAGAVFIGYQRWGLHMERPGGLINAITFGDLSLCMGMLCLAASLDFTGRSALWPALGALAGLVGSVATGTRGGWVAIVLAVILFARYGRVLAGRVHKGVGWLALALFISTYFIPQTGARERVEQGIADVQQYLAGGASNANTNVGVRLELWRGGALLVTRHPWLGASVPQVKREKQELVTQGVLPGFVMLYDHFHNDALHATVFGGVAGLLAWAGTLLMPFLFFRRCLQRSRQGQPALAAPALAGMLLVLSYFSFGLTEVIFWTGHAAVFYAVMVFLLAGLCLNAAPATAAAPGRPL